MSIKLTRALVTTTRERIKRRKTGGVANKNKNRSMVAPIKVTIRLQRPLVQVLFQT